MLAPRNHRRRRSVGRIVPKQEEEVGKTVRLPESLWGRIERIARETDNSLAATLRYLIEWSVLEEEKSPEEHDKKK